jgi:hypothetical protein
MNIHSKQISRVCGIPGTLAPTPLGEFPCRVAATLVGKNKFSNNRKILEAGFFYCQRTCGGVEILGTHLTSLTVAASAL